VPLKIMPFFKMHTKSAFPEQFCCKLEGFFSRKLKASFKEAEGLISYEERWV